MSNSAPAPRSGHDTTNLNHLLAQFEITAREQEQTSSMTKTVTASDSPDNMLSPGASAGNAVLAERNHNIELPSSRHSSLHPHPKKCPTTSITSKSPLAFNGVFPTAGRTPLRQYNSSSSVASGRGVQESQSPSTTWTSQIPLGMRANQPTFSQQPSKPIRNDPRHTFKPPLRNTPTRSSPRRSAAMGQSPRRSKLLHPITSRQMSDKMHESPTNPHHIAVHGAVVPVAVAGLSSSQHVSSDEAGNDSFESFDYEGAEFKEVFKLMDNSS